MLTIEEGEQIRPGPEASEDRWAVFLVDDDEDDSLLAVRVLRQSPRISKVVCISSGTALLARLNALQAQDENNTRERAVILLDIHMPRLDGLTLLETLKADPFTARFPIVMVTGDREEAKQHKSYMLNANAFITKPIGEEHIDKLHKVFDTGTGWRESNN